MNMILKILNPLYIKIIKLKKIMCNNQSSSLNKLKCYLFLFAVLKCIILESALSSWFFTSESLSDT